MKIGDRIRELRVNRRIKQDELAEKLGVNRMTMSNYERGVKHVTLDIIDRIAKILNVDTLELLRPVYKNEYEQILNNNGRVKDRTENNYTYTNDSIQCNVKSILKHLDLEKLYNDDEDMKNLEHNIINIIKFESYKKINNL